MSAVRRGIPWVFLPVLLWGLACDDGPTDVHSDGRLRVTTSTTGHHIDPDGYRLLVRGEVWELPSNGTVVIEEVPAGTLALALDDLALNCAVLTGPAQVTVPSGETRGVLFEVSCLPAGTLDLLISTTGQDPDPNGFLLQARSIADAALVMALRAVSGSRLIPGFPAGEYEMELLDVAANCEATPAVLSFTVEPDRATPLAVDVACRTPTTLAYVSHSTGGTTEIRLINANGTGDRSLISPMPHTQDLAWSPDGSRIAFARLQGNYDIWMMDGDGTNPIRLTSTSENELGPSWSPDGTRIVFWRESYPDSDLFVMSTDGSNVERLTEGPEWESGPAWSPDGTTIAYTRSGSSVEIYLMDATGANQRRWTGYDGSASQPAWSPDGRRLAFVVVECPDCLWVVRVASVEGEASSSMVGTGWDPTWSPDGRHIAHLSDLHDPFSYYYYPELAITIVRADGKDPQVIAQAHTSSLTWR